MFSEGGCNNGTKTPVPYNPQGIVSCDKLSKNSKSVGGKVGDAHKTAIKRGTEYVQTTTNYPNKIIKMVRDSSSLHPTQKPVVLMEYLIKTYTNEGDTVLDFTAGSFTTGVACVNLNRKFIGIELDGSYFDIGVNRIKERIKCLDLKIEPVISMAD